jgi:hypothetical protein
MNTTNPRAKEVWSHTLDAVRRERRQRKMRRAVFAVSAVLLPALLMVARKGPESAAVAKVDWSPPAIAIEQPALAVLVIRDGVPTLESLFPGDLPDTELHLSLDPILADYRDLSEEKF